MALIVGFATPEDVEAIAALHLVAFDSNPLLHVQFPSPSSLAALKSILCNDMLRSVQDGERSGKVILVARDPAAGNSIISFAKWDLPGMEKDVEVHPEVSWPPDCRTEYLDGYHELAERMKSRVVGNEKCYRMTFVGTDPNHQGRGAATVLTKWGLDRAEKDKIPVYLESTMNAVSLYQKLGFVSVDKLSLKLPGNTPDGNSNVYEELGMLRTW